jgi:oligopeptide transport system substrate-binding protein
MHTPNLRRAPALLAFVLLLALSGCAERPQMSGPSARATLIAGAPTVTPKPWETPRTAAPTSLPTPNLPMATPYATPQPHSEHFVVAEMGFQIDHPFHWSRSSQAVPGTIVQLANKPNDVFVLILRGPTEGREIAGAAGDMHERVAEWLGGLELREESSADLEGGVAVWRGTYELDASVYGVAIESLMQSVTHGRQLITMAAYATAEDLAAERETVAAIFNSVRLSEPSVYGLPRNETYVYAENEAIEGWAYDPALGQGDRRVFSGLVGLDAEQRLQAELAESWSISPDGTQYTFHLRPEARFHDGKPVTAQDVIYSWERALDPATKSDIALTYLGDIVGAAERQRGEAQSVSGLQALDEHTLQVTIDGPKPYFLLKLTTPPAAVVDRANVGMGAEWYRRPNGTGPYRLISWMPGRVKLYERNESFYGEAPATRYLAARLDVGYSGTYLYELGELDQVTLDSYSMSMLDGPESPLRTDLQERAPLCTSFVAFDTSRAPFDDPQVRQAFALAVDHQKYAERAMGGSSLMAQGLFPPGLPGFSADMRRLAFSPEEARARLAASRYGAEPLPPIRLTSSGYGFHVNAGIGVLVQMWQEMLGAEISIEQLEPGRFAETVQGSEGGNLFFWEWCADYPDPENFADALFHSGGQQNIGRYSNADLDGLLERARVEADVTRRMELYHQAEAMIMGEAAAIFLEHRVDAMLVEPRVSGAVSAPGHVPVERFLKLEMTP